MTLHRSIFISFGLHLLICGCALAFAQYGSITGMRTDTIMVSLVGSSSGSQHRAQKAEKLDAVQMDAPIPAQDTGPQRMQENVPAPAETTRSKESAAGSATQGESGEVGSRAGILTPNQWQLIQAALERAKNYPRMARERGIEGIVHLRFKVLPSGDVERVEVLRSSGYAILDSASVKTVYQSRPLPHVTGWIEVPISYMLK